MSYQCLVFDWDGTLSDSVRLIVEAMHRSVKSMGLEARADKELQHVIGLGLKEAMNHLYPELTEKIIDELVTQYRLNYRHISEEMPELFPGVIDLLELLHQQGYLLAIATGKSRNGLSRSLSQTGIEQFIHASCCSDEALSKPHPLMLENLMKELKVSREGTLMIGDTEFDLQMANNAGVACVAVNYGAHSPDHLLKFNPQKCFSNLNDLPGWLSNIATIY
jgi:phosphoglycolate phosphatase